jgi:hypothetical protein
MHASDEDGTRAPPLNRSAGPQVTAAKKEERQLRRYEI